MSQTSFTFADLQGEPQPPINIGLELGIFIYITQDGRWHVRWNGNEKGQRPIRFFYLWGGDISAARIENITTFRFDPGQPDNYSLRREVGQDVLNFNGVVFSDVDGLDFDVVGGDQVSFTLTGKIKNREAFLQPQLIFLGPNKTNPIANNFVVTRSSPPPPAAAPALFWTDSGPADIQTAALTDTPAPVALVSMEYTSYGLALDPAGQKIYWSDSGASLSAANLDGTNVSPLLTGMSFVAYGLGLDLANNLVYSAEPRAGKIWRVHLDTGQADELVAGLISPVDVALDLVHGKIYWVEYGDMGSLGCANLDGSGVTHPVSGLAYPQGVALDINNGTLYWAEKTAIRRANIDGSNSALIVSLPGALGNMLSRRVVLDTTAAKVYWTDRATMVIQWANMSDVDGVPETVLDNLTSPALLVPPFYS